MEVFFRRLNMLLSGNSNKKVGNLGNPWEAQMSRNIPDKEMKALIAFSGSGVNVNK
jgi:hypothetical protein